MNRQQKEVVVSDFKKMFTESQAAFLVNYKGLSVALLQLLRKNLRESGGTLKVTKARLMKIAAQDAASVDGDREFGALNDFKSSFHDQVGLVFSAGDASSLAKALFDFSKDHEQLKVVSGFFEKKVLSSNELVALATLPSREELLSMIARAMQGPVSGLACVLNLMIVRLLYVLKQVAEQGKTGE